MITNGKKRIGHLPSLGPGGQRVALGLLLTVLFCSVVPVAGQENAARRRPAQRDTTPTLGLEQGVTSFDTPAFDLSLVDASQTVAGLDPKGGDGFDFTPSDWLERRDANGFFHLGDLNLRLREGGAGEWRSYSTAAARGPVALECLIGVDGRVTKTQILRSVPLLDEAVVEAVQQWGFEPMVIDGVTVPVLMTVFVDVSSQ